MYYVRADIRKGKSETEHFLQRGILICNRSVRSTEKVFYSGAPKRFPSATIFLLCPVSQTNHTGIWTFFINYGTANWSNYAITIPENWINFVTNRSFRERLFRIFYYFYFICYIFKNQIWKTNYSFRFQNSKFRTPYIPVAVVRP